MVEPDAPDQHGVERYLRATERGRRSLSPRPGDASISNTLTIPKNRSTGNLLAHSAGADRLGRLQLSYDQGFGAADYDSMSRSPVMTDHEHGLGTSGLRRIRQQPAARPPTIPSSGASSRTASIGPRSNSLSTAQAPNSRSGSSGAMSPGLTTPTLTFNEDLVRFPTESLHSFSFAQQSEEFIHNRQNVLKRSIDFMSKSINRLHAGGNAGIASAQVRVSGEQEAQSMLDLLARARIVGTDGMGDQGLGILGPLTGHTQYDGDNVFDRTFLPQSESPQEYSAFSPLSATRSRDFAAAPDAMDIPSTTTSKDEVAQALEGNSEVSSRTPTNESGTTAKTTPPETRRQSLKNALTDASSLALQSKLRDAMLQPYEAENLSVSPKLIQQSIPKTSAAFNAPLRIPSYPQAATSFRDQMLTSPISQFAPSSYQAVTGPHPMGPAVHGHASRWAPAAQAIFTTESKAPWTILAANDLACLVFGVTKAEVRKMGILEVVREERRSWLEDKLCQPGSEAEYKARPVPQSQSQHASPTSSTTFLLGKGNGVTASLLSKPSSRQKATMRRVQTDDGTGSGFSSKRKTTKGGPNHASNKSRGVLLCGDVVPIQKRNGQTGSASLWVKEKRGGLIWVLEEIHEDVAYISLNDDGVVTKITGSTVPIWGDDSNQVGVDIGKLLPRIPRQGIDPRTGEIDYAEVRKQRYFAARNLYRVNIPTAVEKVPESTELRVSSFPHIAGIIVLDSRSLEITSSNSVFCAALFGQQHPDGQPITNLIPDFDRILQILREEDGVRLVDGIVIPEHSFRRARAFLALRDGQVDAAAYFLRPDGLPAKHRDGSELKIDVQMRVVLSDARGSTYDEDVIEEEDDVPGMANSMQMDVVYALWITYSRNIHATNPHSAASPMLSGVATPLRQPSPGQSQTPLPMVMEDFDEPKKDISHASLLTKQLKDAAMKAAAIITGQDISRKESAGEPQVPEIGSHQQRKSIDDFVILEDMGQGAYGQVKLARYKKSGNKMVIKYVTKRRILVDTWTRDRRLGTVPLEIHVLDYLRRDGLSHPNIVEMADFFEDDINYYIEMIPHGLPGMDLFDYIELRVNMEEGECKSIFVQVARAVHHLHTKAFVVHRDVKDENVVLDGEGNIKLIDFGSAAYIKNGPFDVFVGTIDYAAPEVLAGKPYRGKEQDVWALGILLYTIVYKENPFYSIDEIMDRDLRVPYIMSDDSIDLIRGMLDRDVDDRMDINTVLNHPWCQSERAVD